MGHSNSFLPLYSSFSDFFLSHPFCFFVTGYTLCVWNRGLLYSAHIYAFLLQRASTWFIKARGLPRQWLLNKFYDSGLSWVWFHLITVTKVPWSFCPITRIRIFYWKRDKIGQEWPSRTLLGPGTDRAGLKPYSAMLLPHWLHGNLSFCLFSLAQSCSESFFEQCKFSTALDFVYI